MNNYQPDGNNIEVDAPQAQAEVYTVTTAILDEVLDESNKTLHVDLDSTDALVLEMMPRDMLFAAGFFAGVYLEKQRSGN